jgi:hypothetical protein
MESELIPECSRAQYERYVHDLDQPKNLKKKEWRAVHAIRQELLNQGFQTRIKVLGKVVSKEKLQRAFRHALLGAVEESQQNLAGMSLI